MTLKKTYSKSKEKCKVTFSFPENNAKNVCVVGDFNEWDVNATPMKKSKQGFSATVELDSGRSYQYRYFVDGERWENDNSAEDFVPSPYFDSQNCVVKA